MCRMLVCRSKTSVASMAVMHVKLLCYVATYDQRWHCHLHEANSKRTHARQMYAHATSNNGRFIRFQRRESEIRWYTNESLSSQKLNGTIGLVAACLVTKNE